MNNRHVDSLVRTEFLDDDDFLITEENELLRKVSVLTLEKTLSYSSPINNTPRVYTGYRILGGKSVYSKRAVHFTVKSMIEAAYGSTGIGNKLKLFVLTTEFKEAIFETIGDITTAVFSSDLSEVTFSIDDWTAYDAFLISPWGLVPNTDSFVEDSSIEGKQNRSVAFSEEYPISTFTTASGKIVIDGYQPEGTILPFFVLFQDLDKYLILYYKDSYLFAKLTTPNGTREQSVAYSGSETEFSIVMNLVTGECSVTFDLDTLVLQTAEGDFFGYEESGEIYVFGYTSGSDIISFGTKIEFSNPVTIYIGKDFSNSYFYNPIYDFTNGV
jgi:hypothetical protein